MKIAVASDKPGLDGSVEPRLGLAAYMLVVETEDMSFEVLEGPSRESGHGAGIVAVSLALNLDARVILAGHVAPHIVDVLGRKGVEVVTNASGPVEQSIRGYLEARAGAPQGGEMGQAGARAGKTPQRESWGQAWIKGARQLYSLLPRLLGVVMLLGLFQGFVSKETLLALFSGSSFHNSVLGAALGSVMVGNPVNSYVIAKNLTAMGVGLVGGVALMLAWVTVGVIQLPAESAALGPRFALVRNLAGLGMAVFLSYFVVLCGGGAS